MQITSILALPLKAVPLMPLVSIELVASRLFKLLLSAHGDMFERLGTYKSNRFSFAPTDLPLIFLIEPHLLVSRWCARARHSQRMRVSRPRW